MSSENGDNNIQSDEALKILMEAIKSDNERELNARPPFTFEARRVNWKETTISYWEEDHFLTMGLEQSGDGLDLLVPGGLWIGTYQQFRTWSIPSNEPIPEDKQQDIIKRCLEWARKNRFHIRLDDLRQPKLNVRRITWNILGFYYSEVDHFLYVPLNRSTKGLDILIPGGRWIGSYEQFGKWTHGMPEQIPEDKQRDIAKRFIEWARKKRLQVRLQGLPSDL